jgi:hypothetical protein
MTTALPSVEQYERLLPVAKRQMLLPLFLLSVALSYSSDLGMTGSIVVRLKRLFLVVLLLISFPMIAEFSQIIGVEIAKSIDNMAGIDLVLDAAAKRAEGYSMNLQSLLSIGGDFFVSVLVKLSFVILILARYLLLAFQHFYWLLLIALGPFLILGTLFDAASGITMGLYKNMFQVASWPIIWAILSAFLKALPFTSAYSGPGEYVTVITLNLLIATALFFSPFIVSQLCEGVNLSVGDTLRRGALRAVSHAGPHGIVFSAASKSASVGQKSFQVAKSQFKGKEQKGVT